MRRPLMVFALPNDDRTRDATIALLQIREVGNDASVFGVFEDQEEVNKKVLARFTTSARKQFSSFDRQPGSHHALSAGTHRDWSLTSVA